MPLRVVIMISLLLTALSANPLLVTQTVPTATSNNQSKTDILLASLSGLQVVAAQELRNLQGTSQVASLQAKYQMAKAAQDEFVSLTQQGLGDGAVPKGFEAISLYKSMLEAASLNGSDPNVEACERVITLKTYAGRLIKYLERIESRVTQAEKLGYSTTGIESNIMFVRHYLKDASAALEIPDARKVESLLSAARAELGKLETKLSALTVQIQTTRAGQYVAAAKLRISELKTTILTNTPKLSVTTLSTSTTAVNQAQTSLTAAETYYKEGIVDKTIQSLVGFSVKEQQAIEILKNSGVTVSSVDTP